MKRYSEQEVKRVLKQELEIPKEVDDRIYETYQALSGRSYQRGKGISCKKWILAGTAAAMLAMTSMGALAANGFFTKQVIEQGDSLSYEFDVDYEMTPHEVYVTPEYIPDGYVKYGEGTYDKDGQHKDGISICGINASWLAANQEFLKTTDLKNLEKTRLGGMEAHILTLDMDGDRMQRGFDKRVYLFNPQEGYVIAVYGGNDLPMEELKKVADHLTVEVDESKTLEYVDAEKKEKEEAAAREWEDRRKQVLETGASKNQVFGIGEAFSPYQDGVEVTALGAELLESVDGFAKENFYDYEETVAYWVNPDGTLKDYERISCDRDSMEELSREMAGQKILKVRFRAVNLSDETVDFWAGGGSVCEMQRQADGRYAYAETYKEAADLEHGLVQMERVPVWFDMPQHTGEDRTHFFFRDLQPQESLEYTLLYVVDEDMADNMYLNYNVSDDLEEDLFVEVSIKE